VRTKLKSKAALAAIPVMAAAAVALPTAMASASPHHAARTVAVKPADGLPTITVTMTGTKITVGGTLQSGGTQIVSTVTGEPTGAPIFVRLDPGVSYAKFFKLLSGPAGPDPNYLDGYASIVTDAAAPAGTSTIQADLQAGQYVAFDSARGNPSKWPFTTFTIAANEEPASLPAPDATVSAIEFDFRGPGTLQDGQLVRFGNHGFLVHMIVYFTASDAANASKLAAALKAGNRRLVRQLATGQGTFAGPLSHDSYQQLVVNSKPGYYVLACFMTDQEGTPHIMLGMERVIQITQ
jgi:hypothetical protein